MENWSRYETPRHNFIFAYIFTRLNIVLKIKTLGITLFSSMQSSSIISEMRWIFPNSKSVHNPEPDTAAVQLHSFISIWLDIHSRFIHSHSGLKIRGKKRITTFLAIDFLIAHFFHFYPTCGYSQDDISLHEKIILSAPKAIL